MKPLEYAEGSLYWSILLPTKSLTFRLRAFTNCQRALQLRAMYSTNNDANHDLSAHSTVCSMQLAIFLITGAKMRKS